MEKPKANKRRDRKDKSSHAIKIVVRHLPPTMTEKEFLEQVDPLPENDSYYFCPADWSLGQEATCRAYIDMSHKDIAEVLQFRDRFDGYVFVDSKGVEYVAIVEYAPFQCFLKNKGRNNDNKVNTVEKETHYQEFLQKLTEEREEATRLGDLKIDFNFEQKSDEKVKSTPLLQYLANKKEKRREEARKRNEEKRKQREEQKLLRATEQPPENSKAKDSTNENKKPVNSNANKKVVSKEGQAPEEGVKNSRSKRRTERDQRRREEHEQRKLVRDRENRDKKKTDKDSNSQNLSKQNIQTKDKQKPNKEIVILKKETIIDASLTKSTDELPDKSPDKSLDISAEKSISKSADSSAVKAADKSECSERLTTNNSKESTKNVIKSKEVGKSAKHAVLTESTTQSKSRENSKPSNASKKANYRSAEERRIKNKDRPSIAIYQPKVRTRLGSEEICSIEAKDCGTEVPEGNIVLPDEKAKTKRFGGRRYSKQKSQDNKDSNDRTRCSKSSESNTSVQSATLNNI